MAQVYHNDQQSPTKICSKCHEVKPLTAFHKDSTQSTGYRCACIECLKKDRKRKPFVQLTLVFTKTCSICHIEKSLDAFTVNYTRCKPCENAIRRQRVENREHVQHPSGVKVCPQCEAEKPLSEFYKNTWGIDGYASHCKKCQDAQKTQWNAEHVEHVREQKKARYTPEEKREYNQAYRQENREELLSYSHQRYVRTHETCSIAGKKWRQANPLKYRESNRRRHAIKKNATVEKVSYEAILERDGAWCYICEKPIEPHHKINFDHVIPLVRGGSHSETNLKVTHSNCNHRKGKRLLEEMTPYQRRGVTE